MRTRTRTSGWPWRHMALMAVLVAAHGCGDDDTDGDSAADDGGGSETVEVVSTAATCRALPDDPVFGGTAVFVSEINAGEVVGCTVEVPAGSAALETLNVSVSDCPPDAGVFLHFLIEDDGWHLDREQLAEHNRDNGECAVEG